MDNNDKIIFKESMSEMKFRSAMKFFRKDDKNDDGSINIYFLVFFMKNWPIFLTQNSLALGHTYNIIKNGFEGGGQKSENQRYLWSR